MMIALAGFSILLGLFCLGACEEKGCIPAIMFFWIGFILLMLQLWH